MTASAATSVVLAACSGSAATPSAVPHGPPGYSAAEAAGGASHDCIVPGSGSPRLTWSNLRNPVLSSSTAGVKDQALIWWDGSWHMLFSYVTGEHASPGQEHWDIATATSRDLVHWSAPSAWPDQPGGIASPDIVRSPDGRFVATYDGPPDEGQANQAKLYYRTSTDLIHWSPPVPLAPTLHPQADVRMIDAALAWTGNGLILGYKVGTTSQRQAFEIAWSPSGALDGPWQIVGQPSVSVYGDTFENYEFVVIDGRWRLVATSNVGDQPWMYTLGGPPSRPSSWLRWTGGNQLLIPSAAWDSGPGASSVGFEQANSVFLCAINPRGGVVYATYAGSTELTEFGGWGHAAVGIARSTDLVHWQVPPVSRS